MKFGGNMQNNYSDIWNYYDLEIAQDPRKWAEKIFGKMIFFEDVRRRITKISFEHELVEEESKYTLRNHHMTYGGAASQAQYYAKIGFVFDKKLYASDICFKVCAHESSAADDYEFGVYYYMEDNVVAHYIEEVLISTPLHVDSFPEDYINVVDIEGDVSLSERIKLDMPYVYPILNESGIPVELFYAFPSMEILYKAGYTNLCKDVADSYCHENQKNIQYFKRLCKDGTSPKTIFKTSKSVYQALKERNVSLHGIDELRKTNKCSPLEKDTVLQIIDNNLTGDNSSMRNSRYILNATYNGRPLFKSYDVLMNKLRRLDMYEALSPKEGLQYLADYIRNCQILDIKPNIESDSLLREHNVTSRLVYQKTEKEKTEGLIEACIKLQQYDWSNGNFFIRAIRDKADLLSEASQQRNCVAAYASSIASGRSKIFVLRRCAAPDKSLITIEMSADMRTLRQACLSHNRTIQSDAQNSAIRQWIIAIQEGNTHDWDLIPNDLSYKEKCAFQDEMYRNRKAR